MVTYSIHRQNENASDTLSTFYSTAIAKYRMWGTFPSSKESQLDAVYMSIEQRIQTIYLFKHLSYIVYTVVGAFKNKQDD